MNKRFIDRLIQIFFFFAYRACMIVWFIFRPATFGVNVAIWHNHQILLVKTSYKKECSLPGGYVKQNEEITRAAQRELIEELNIQINPERFVHIGQYTSDKEYKRDTTHIFEIHLSRAPAIKKDDREIVWADFKSPDDALSLNLSPYARTYLEQASVYSRDDGAS